MLATLERGEWSDAGRPVVLLADSGTGKSHLLIGLGMAACQRGLRVRYTTAAALVNELAEAADERTLSRLVARYGRLDLLCLDEFGYVHLDPRGAELLFQVLTEREERASVAVASNAPFAEWGQTFAGPPPRPPRSSTGSRSMPTSSRPAANPIAYGSPRPRGRRPDNPIMTTGGGAKTDHHRGARISCHSQVGGAGERIAPVYPKRGGRRPYHIRRTQVRQQCEPARIRHLSAAPTDGRSQQQQRVPLEGVLGHPGVDQRVPAARNGQAGDPGCPGAHRLLGNRAAVKAAREGPAVRRGEQVCGIGRLLEEGGPDRLEGGLGADHGEEPESLGVRVACEGVDRRRESAGG